MPDITFKLTQLRYWTLEKPFINYQKTSVLTVKAKADSSYRYIIKRRNFGLKSIGDL